MGGGEFFIWISEDIRKFLQRERSLHDKKPRPSVAVNQSAGSRHTFYRRVDQSALVKVQIRHTTPAGIRLESSNIRTDDQLRLSRICTCRMFSGLFIRSYLRTLLCRPSLRQPESFQLDAKQHYELQNLGRGQD